MALLLNIDTATDLASVCLTQNGKIIGFEENPDQKNHGAFLQPAIKKIFAGADVSLNDIDAVAVTIGPGSYTGLRVGLASAKGLCYALNKPLIAVSTLQVIALAAQSSANYPASVLFCPMIDARRMEVFTAVYDNALNEIIQPQAKILDESSFGDELKKSTIVFCGNGNIKLKNILPHPSAIFSEVSHNATHLSVLAHKFFALKNFANLAYSEPVYVKDFFSPTKP